MHCRSFSCQKINLLTDLMSMCTYNVIYQNDNDYIRSVSRKHINFKSIVNESRVILAQYCLLLTERRLEAILLLTIVLMKLIGGILDLSVGIISRPAL